MSDDAARRRKELLSDLKKIKMEFFTNNQLEKIHGVLIGTMENNAFLSYREAGGT